jgi:hypothetical protein
MRRLFERKGKTRRAMLEDRRRDPKHRLAVDHSFEQLPRTKRLCGEGILQPELRCRRRARRIDFGDHKSEIADKAIDQVPLIGLKLMAHPVDEAGRAIKVHRRLASDQHPQQEIKSNKVVDMSMRNKDVFDTADIARR